MNYNSLIIIIELYFREFLNLDTQIIKKKTVNYVVNQIKIVKYLYPFFLQDSKFLFNTLLIIFPDTVYRSGEDLI